MARTPTLFTAYTRYEIEEDAFELASAGARVVVAPRLNPWRGLRPYVDPWRPDACFCVNQFVLGIRGA